MTDQFLDLLEEKLPITAAPDIESAWRQGLRRRRLKVTGRLTAVVAVAAIITITLLSLQGAPTHQVLATGQPTAGLPSTLYAAGDCGTLYEVAPATGLKAIATISGLTGRNGPTGLAIDQQGNTAYVAGPNQVWPVNLTSGTVGNPIDFAGTVETLNLAPDGSTLYVGTTSQSTSNRGSLIPVSLPSGQPETPIELPGTPIAVLIGPDASTAYVDIAEVWAGTSPNASLVAAGEVATVDLRDGAVMHQLKGTGQNGLYFVGLSADGALAYAYSSYTAADIETVETNSGRVVSSIPLSQPVALNGFAFSPSTETLYLLAQPAPGAEQQSAIFAVDLTLGTTRLVTYLEGYGQMNLTLGGDQRTLWFAQAPSNGAVPDQLGVATLPAGTTSVIAEQPGCTLSVQNSPGRPSASPTGIDTGRH